LALSGYSFSSGKSWTLWISFTFGIKQAIQRKSLPVFVHRATSFDATSFGGISFGANSFIASPFGCVILSVVFSDGLILGVFSGVFFSAWVAVRAILHFIRTRNWCADLLASSR
jgi:hypothetical protein